MKGHLLVTGALTLGLLTMVSASVSAHHGNAAYADDITEFKQATVTKVAWANPHALINFDAKDAKGNLVHMVVESAAPLGYVRYDSEPALVAINAVYADLRLLQNLFLAAGLLLAVVSTGAAQQAPNVRPGSITSEDVPYPHPVSYLRLTLYQQDLRMAYMDVAPLGTPNGRTVVLLHGNNFAGFYFGGPIEALRKQGFRVVVPDQIGYGRSSKPFIPYNLHDMARNTRLLLQSLKIDKAMVVGHSMGGMVATRFATQYPDMTERLVLSAWWIPASRGRGRTPTRATGRTSWPPGRRRARGSGGTWRTTRRRGTTSSRSTRASATPGRSAPSGRGSSLSRHRENTGHPGRRS